MEAKTHVVLDLSTSLIILFASLQECETHIRNSHNSVGYAMGILPAALLVSTQEVITPTEDSSRPDIEEVEIYRHLAGDYLFAIDSSWVEQADTMLAWSPIDQERLCLIESMDPCPDGTANV